MKFNEAVDILESVQRTLVNRFFVLLQNGGKEIEAKQLLEKIFSEQDHIIAFNEKLRKDIFDTLLIDENIFKLMLDYVIKYNITHDSFKSILDTILFRPELNRFHWMVKLAIDNTHWAHNFFRDFFIKDSKSILTVEDFKKIIDSEFELHKKMDPNALLHFLIRLKKTYGNDVKYFKTIDYIIKMYPEAFDVIESNLP
jgi:hypothetical protein